MCALLYRDFNCDILRHSAVFQCSLHCPFLKRLTVMNKHHTAETVVSVSKNLWSERHTEDRIICWNTSLYLQEDTSPWNSRLRRAQVSYLFLQLLYVITELISVFTVFWRFRIFAKRAFVCSFFVCVLFVSGPAHILCLTVASGWNRERCIPEILRLLRHRNFCSVLDAHCYNFRVRYLSWLNFSQRLCARMQHFVCSVNAELTAVTEVLKTSVQFRI